MNRYQNYKRPGVSLLFNVFPIIFSIGIQANTLEEIVVTAQKREQSIQDVGISVTAFSGDQLRALGASNTTDIVNFTPALQLYEFSPTQTSFNIRGVSQNGFSDNLESPVAVYVDDVYLASPGSVNGQLFDTERVEVLRGPQGTLFGRNATGGLINFISKRPTDVYSGYLQAISGDYDLIEVEGAVGGAIVADKASGRLSFKYKNHDGFVESQIPGVRDAKGANATAVRGQLLLNLSDAVTALVKVHWSDDDDVPDGAYTREIGFNDPATGLGEYVPGGRATGSEVNKTFSNTEGFFDRTVWGANVTLNWALGDNIEMVSITSYLEMDKDFLEDTDASPVSSFIFATEQAHDQFSQEIRLSGSTERTRWQTGVYYLDIEQSNLTTIDGFRALSPVFDPSFVTVPPGAPFEPGQFRGDNTFEATNWSVFAQGEYDFNDKFTVIAGLRWSQDDKEVDMFARNISQATGTVTGGFGPGADSPPLPPFTFNKSTDPRAEVDYGDFAFKLELDWKPDENSLYYASFNRGIKGGNFISIAATDTVDLEGIAHDEEVLLAYEIGAKRTFLDGRARVNAAIYYYDYNDYQSFAIVNVAQQIKNVDAEAYGGEIELFYSPPVEGLEFLLGVALSESEVHDAVFPGSETELPNAPAISINGLARYQWDSFQGGKMAFQVDFLYNDDQYFDPLNAGVNFEESYVIGNLRLSYQTADERWQAALWAKNFSDEKYRVYSLDVTTAPSPFIDSVFAPPRWVGATVSYNW